ncbi:hypothetical protein [Sphingosinicella sp. BN140058]|uniref:hypothetical protein n=1 Tax=Sphingosinicella sp. BN140058 TaxID=1892855 RepID=UPI001010F3CF|nr:hypothetical protein [Sphingosinicella sp. BN140058]QAY80160.1 hypothetical protein ETR14_26315 [Sphingosinicella sp. BN140058]
MKVALDLDNTLIATVEGARLAMARDHGLEPSEIIDTNIYFDPFTHHDEHLAAKLRPDFAFWDREDVLLGAPLLPGAHAAAWRLEQAGLLGCYITRRPPAVARITLRYREHHGLPPRPIEHVGTSDGASYYDTCKSTICSRYGISHVIDDHVKEAELLHSAGIEVILVDAPIGRAARAEFAAAHPHIRIMPDAASAVALLLSEHAVPRTAS